MRAVRRPGDLRPEMMATVMPAAATCLMPWPSRTWKALSDFAARAVVQPPVGEHAVHVEHQQLHAAQGRQETSRGRSQHPGAQQVVHVERADQHARVVDHRQGGDAVFFHEMRGFGRQFLRRAPTCRARS